MSGVEFGDPRLPPRFWSKVRVDVSGCWIWTARVSHGGYGAWWSGREEVRAHRAVVLAARDIPEGMECSHLCHVRRCVNPTHVVIESHRDNVIRSTSLITQCPQGHPYDAANGRHEIRKMSNYTGIKRYCRACRTARQRTRRHLSRAKNQNRSPQ